MVRSIAELEAAITNCLATGHATSRPFGSTNLVDDIVKRDDRGSATLDAVKTKHHALKPHHSRLHNSQIYFGRDQPVLLRRHSAPLAVIDIRRLNMGNILRPSATVS